MAYELVSDRLRRFREDISNDMKNEIDECFMKLQEALAEHFLCQLRIEQAAWAKAGFEDMPVDLGKRFFRVPQEAMIDASRAALKQFRESGFQIKPEDDLDNPERTYYKVCWQKKK